MDMFWIHVGILCISTYLFFSFLGRKPASHPSNLPPGRNGWPVVGEMWDLFMANRRGTPEEFINDRTQKYSSDVFKTSLLGEQVVVFCGAKGNKFLFSNENRYLTVWLPASARKLVSQLAKTDEDHVLHVMESVRRFLPEYLKPWALHRYIPVMDSSAKVHVANNWSPNDHIKIGPVVKKFSFELACKLFLNVEDHERVKRLQDPFVSMVTGLFSLPMNLPGTAYNGAVKAGERIRRELVEIIEERKRELEEKKGTDGVDMLTQMLLQQQTDGHDRHQNIICKIVALLFASYDPVSTAITLTFYFLAQHPLVYENVFQEQMTIAKSKDRGELLNWEDLQKMKYSWWVTCEAMRLAPPSPGAFREAIVDFNYNGFTIPKGWKASWMCNSTHKNPKYFPKPENFDPLRFEGSGPVPFSFVAFGGGPHMCPGREYARLGILVFIHNVVTKFKFEKLNPNEKIIYTPNPTPSDGLLVQLISIHDTLPI